MKRPPKSFQLGGHTFEIRLVSQDEMDRKVAESFPNDEEGHSAYGLFRPDELIIFLLKPTRHLKLSVVMQAFWHEYAHAHLWVHGDPRWTDEDYVDRMGHLLHQAHQTFTF